MRKLIAAAALTAVVLATAVVALAGNGTPINTGSANELTVAAYGDTPYSAALLADQPRLVDSINSDPKVDLVLQVGDIHWLPAAPSLPVAAVVDVERLASTRS
jgi:hypothetical protein